MTDNQLSNDRKLVTSMTDTAVLILLIVDIILDMIIDNEEDFSSAQEKAHTLKGRKHAQIH